MIKIFIKRKQTNRFFSIESPLSLLTLIKAKKKNMLTLFFQSWLFWLQMTTQLNLSLAQKELNDSKDDTVFRRGWLQEFSCWEFFISPFLCSVWIHSQKDAVQVKQQVAPGNCQFICSLEVGMPERKIKSMCFPDIFSENPNKDSY